MIQDEWDIPEAALRGTRAMTRLYPHPDQERALLHLPKVDVAVSAVTKKTIILVEGRSALKDVQEHKLETLLKQAFVNVLSLQVSVCGTFVAHACLRWAQGRDLRINRGVTVPSARGQEAGVGCSLLSGCLL